jgi:Flp pilus assembly protein TadD
VVLASMARQLRGRLAFQWDTWDQAAAYALEHRMRLDDALEWTARSAGERPTFQAAITRAAILDELGRGSEAVAVRREALEMDATEAEVIRAGRRMLAAGLPAHAVTVFRHAVAEYPDAWGAHAGLADAMVAAGDPAGAAEHYRHAVERAPADRRPALEEALARVQGAPPAR